jgi:NADH-quinone oxidoreductase subunit J
MKTSAAEWAIAGFVGLLLYSVLAVSTVLAKWEMPTTPSSPDAATSPSSVLLGQAFLGLNSATPKADLTGTGSVRVSRYRVSYLLPFEIVSVHLLVVLIGAAYLARAKRRRGEVVS